MPVPLRREAALGREVGETSRPARISEPERPRKDGSAADCLGACPPQVGMPVPLRREAALGREVGETSRPARISEPERPRKDGSAADCLGACPPQVGMPVPLRREAALGVRAGGGLVGWRVAWAGALSALALGAQQAPDGTAPQEPASSPPAAKAPADDDADADTDSFIIRNIDITTRDVFTQEEAQGNLIYGLANFLHYTTDKDVIRTELWFHENDRVTRAEIEELERNLRALGLFGEVRTELHHVDDDTDDLDIWTRDKFSLIVSAGVSSVGGVNTFRGQLGETNLFGEGKRLTVSGRSDDQDQSVLLNYDDPQLFKSWYHANVTAGSSTEGPVAAVSIYKPFKHLTDPVSHGVSLSRVPYRADYYDDGTKVAEVKLKRVGGSAYLAHGFGPSDRRASLGIFVSGTSSRYGAATGSQAASIPVPGDTTEVQIGVRGTLDWAAEYLELENVDTLDYVEDQQLGVTVDLSLAGVLRDENGVGSELQTNLSGRVLAAARPFEDTYLTFELRGASRFGDGDVKSWEGRASVHGFQQSLPAQTLAFALRRDGAEDDQGLPRQLTLGEDNGLRGYPARQFNGTRMTVLNLEDRIATGVEVLSVHIGAVAFADFGWPGGNSPNAGELFRSVGVGLRFGSSNLFGSNVFRLDAAWPLDEQAGRSFDMSLSFSAGQVFSFFGYAIGLSDDVVGFQ